MIWLERQLQQYGSHHTKLVTQLTHFIGVPMVRFSLMMILAWFKLSVPPLFSTNFAWIVAVIVSLFYLYLDWRLGLCLCVILLLMSWGASALVGHTFDVSDFIMCACLFVIGWIIQLVGHFFEEKRPAFIANALQILIAPMFLVAEAAVMAGWRKDLRDIIGQYIELSLD
jgi:uncharacterized membrane protein YGL010W